MTVYTREHARAELRAMVNALRFWQDEPISPEADAHIDDLRFEIKTSLPYRNRRPAAL